MNSIETILMTLSPPSDIYTHISHLTNTISFLFHCHRRPLLRNPLLPHSPPPPLPLLPKSLLFSRYSSPYSHMPNTSCKTRAPPHPLHPHALLPAICMKLRDLDVAALLLFLLLCEIHQHDHKLLYTPHSLWRFVLYNYASDFVLKLSSFIGGCLSSTALIQYNELIGRCQNIVKV